MTTLEIDQLDVGDGLVLAQNKNYSLNVIFISKSDSISFSNLYVVTVIGYDEEYKTRREYKVYNNDLAPLSDSFDIFTCK